MPIDTLDDHHIYLFVCPEYLTNINVVQGISKNNS